MSKIRLQQRAAVSHQPIFAFQRGRTRWLVGRGYWLMIGCKIIILRELNSWWSASVLHSMKGLRSYPRVDTNHQDLKMEIWEWYYENGIMLCTGAAVTRFYDRILGWGYARGTWAVFWLVVRDAWQGHGINQAIFVPYYIFLLRLVSSSRRWNKKVRCLTQYISFGFPRSPLCGEKSFSTMSSDGPYVRYFSRHDSVTYPWGAWSRGVIRHFASVWWLGEV